MSRKHPRRKTTSGRFAMLPLYVLQSPAVQTLDHPTFRVLVLLAAEYMGTNNGALGITANQAFAQGIRSHHTLYKALRELRTRGLIKITCNASRNPPRPTMHALTWLAVDDTQYSTGYFKATHNYRNWPQVAS